MRTTVVTLTGAVLLTAGLAACATSTAASTPLTAAAVAAPAKSGAQPAALTYDTERVPAGAKLGTFTTVDNGQTTVHLTASGLLPGTQYGSHVHTKPCGAKPADSGPHYQNEKDPVSPSVDPKYANAQNEVWLDFTTDSSGTANASATVGWRFRPGEANAIVLHAMHTSTEPGKAGGAGDRLACLTAKF
ncbi:superoxide dismutase family protein [Amycolatopsis pithecellobii]|uniref:Superoxide dismutase n=1 Tax=Amycolatopsis pithecellobii TaxID=664692 RepID=A0A6N7YWF7_9PSEU|nr:superoxide dismutase family protein [Amycolatopsis pithecellobii]MTD56228.1 superoxide dismutase [Amycolatopsis pithecellobii]